MNGTVRPLLSLAFISLFFAAAVALISSTPGVSRTGSLFFRVELASTHSGIGQLFYDVGAGINERDSVRFDVAAGVKRDYQVALPGTPVYAMRFDPINLEATVQLSGARIVDSKGQTVREVPLEAFKPANQIIEFGRLEERLEMRVAPGGNDPFFTVALPADLSPPFEFRAWAKRALLWGSVVLGLITAASALALRHGIQLPLSISTQGGRHPIIAIILVSLVISAIAVIPSQNRANTTPKDLAHSGQAQNHEQPHSPNLNGFRLISSVLGAGATGHAFSSTLVVAVYAAGAAAFILLVTGSWAAAALTSLTAAFSGIWQTAHGGLFETSLAIAPIGLLGWLVIARAENAKKAILGSVLLAAYFAHAAWVEPTLRGALLAMTVGSVGVLLCLTSPTPLKRQWIMAGTGLAVACAATAALTALNPNPWTLSQAASAPAVHGVSATMFIVFFENLLLAQTRESIVFPTTNLLAMAGGALFLARLPIHWGSRTATVLLCVALVLMAACCGALPTPFLHGMMKNLSQIELQHAGAYALVLICTLLAGLGFFAVQRSIALNDSGSYWFKATLLLLSPFVLFYGVAQHHSTYTLKTAHAAAAILAWLGVCAAQLLLRDQAMRPARAVFVTCALLLSIWTQVPLLHPIIDGITGTR